MSVDPKHRLAAPLRITAERRFGGSVFDVAYARRFARVTAEWWGFDPAAVEQIVAELARTAVCREQPAFRLSLSFDGSDVRVELDEHVADAPAPDDRAGAHGAPPAVR